MGETMSLFGRWFGLDAEASCDEGLSALDRRDYELAARAFKVCAEGSRRASTVRLARFHLAECHTQIALSAWARGEAAQARDEIEVALAYTQPTAERHFIAAQIARRLGARAEAAHHVDAALAYVPDHEPALALRALHLYEDGRVDEAVEHARTLPGVDGRLRRFREAHARGDHAAAETHLAAVAAGYPESLI